MSAEQRDRKRLQMDAVLACIFDYLPDWPNHIALRLFSHRRSWLRPTRMRTESILLVLEGPGGVQETGAVSKGEEESGAELGKITDEKRQGAAEADVRVVTANILAFAPAFWCFCCSLVQSSALY
jgi:hypothetical protein